MFRSLFGTPIINIVISSNGGVFGSLFGTPIINPPQSAILGMHGVFERPVVRNGQVRKYYIILVDSSYRKCKN